MIKGTLGQDESLFAGLNSFEPVQEHVPHAHEWKDKLYLLLEGSGLVRVGEQIEHLSAGDAAFAASGVQYSIRNPGPERLVVIVVLAPPTHKRSLRRRQRPFWRIPIFNETLSSLDHDLAGH